VNTVEIPLFPLSSVLYPRGLLPLRIFEARYVDMTKSCIGNDEVFGVCLIREGREVGAPATPEEWGCTARIEDWDVPAPGLFTLRARGERIFRIRERFTTPSGLTRALVQLLPERSPMSVPDRYKHLPTLLERVANELKPESLAPPLQLDNADLVAYQIGRASCRERVS
jgi:Lon protease-like protein